MANVNHIDQTEIWKDIFGFEGLYQVSNLGRIRSLNKFARGRAGCRRQLLGRILKFDVNTKGYPRVQLFRNGNKTKFLVHRLVAIEFVPNPHELPVIDHIDNNPMNATASNLV